MIQLKPRQIAILISLYFVGLGVLYSANTPPFEGPDELAHFVYAHNIVKDRELPVIPDKQTAFDTRNYEVHQLPLYYVTAAPLVALFERGDLTNYFRLNPFASIGSVTGTNTNIQLHPLAQTGDTRAALWAVRMFSLFLGLGTLWCVYHAGRLVWDERIGLTAMFLAASVPTFIHISVSANNDNMNAFLSSVVAVLALVAWSERRLTTRNALLIGAALAGAAITKLTGLAAYSFAVGMAVIGGVTGRFSWRDVMRYVAIIAVCGVLLAGWWYVRSVIIYGDPLAYEEARALWGREIAAPSGFELWGVWESFWMTLGHLNVPGPAWLSPYVTVMAGVGLVGVGVRFARVPQSRWQLVYLLAVTLAVAGIMVYVTRRMNISQGRALFPALTGIAPLLVIGWASLIGRRWAWVPVIPVSAVAITAPFLALGTAFVPLQPVATLPDDLNRIDARAESILFHGYELHTRTVRPGANITLDLYFTGNHPQNPALFVTAQDPITGERLGKVDTYPGMAPTDLIDPNTTYRTRVQFRLSEQATDPRPFQVQLAFGWRVPSPDDAGQGRFVNWFDADDNQIGAVFGAGPVYTDPTYNPPPVVQPVDVQFEGVRLRGYDLQPTDNGMQLELWWERRVQMTTDWTLTVGIVDAQGQMIAQQDAPPPRYPTSAWADVGLFTTTHTIAEIPPSTLSQNDHELRVGWYTADANRMPVLGTSAGAVRDDMVFIPLK